MEIRAALRKNKHDQATVRTSKENMFLRAFGSNRNWLIPECDRDISEKIFSKKNRKVPRKHPHWVAPLFKSRNDIFTECCTFFSKYFGEKYLKKKEVQRLLKTSSLVNTIIQKYLEIFHLWIMMLPDEYVFVEL